MDLIEMGAQMLSEQFGVKVDAQTVRGALSGLLGDGSGDIDLSSLAAKMAGNGELGTLLGSWLGDGANQSISADTITDLFGQDELSRFAGQVGVSQREAAGGLADVIPQIMDKASSGGSLLDQFAGGSGGLLGAAKSLLR